jgi:hypothetical protein
MTQEEKDLLLKDLCARLPYRVKISIPDLWIHYRDIEILDEIFKGDDGLYRVNSKGQLIEHIKPYLFPLSSMTVEQKEFIKNKFCYDWDIDDHPYSLWAYCIEIAKVDEFIDWFHENHFDYQGLIPKKLAIDATNLNIY